MHNWYIGQTIVCIKTHSLGVVKEGEVFTIKDLRKSICKCTGIEINVGIICDGNSGDSYMIKCRDCNTSVIEDSPIYWFCESLFAPLDTLVDISEIEELLSQPIYKTYDLTL